MLRSSGGTDLQCRGSTADDLHVGHQMMQVTSVTLIVRQKIEFGNNVVNECSFPGELFGFQCISW